MAQRKTTRRRTTGTLLPAKLTRPLHELSMSRPRLLSLVAHPNAGGALWIQGSPGAGKTTFAAELVSAHAGDCLWIQLDADDVNPAVLLDFLRKSLARGEAVPPVPDAGAPDLAIAVRRFSRKLFALLKNDSILVLEDFHEIEGSISAALIPALCAEAGSHTRIVMTSRTAPPDCFAEMIAAGQLQVMGGESLRFTPEEAKELISSLGVTEGGERICADADGWAAGITLLASGSPVVARPHFADAVPESPDRGREGAPPARHDQLFAYFSRQAFDRFPHPDQALLLKLSLLTRFTEAGAIDMAGHEQASRVLRALVHRNLFVERRIAKGGEWFQFHPLFRRFLRARLVERTSSGELRAVRLKAADVELGMANDAAAVHLLLACDEHEKAKGVALQAVAPFLEAGRDAELAELISLVQASPCDGMESCRLWYWLGVAKAHTHATGSIAAFRRSYELAVAEQDRFIAFMGAASMTLASALYEDALHELGAWAGRMQSQYTPGLQFADGNMEITAMSAALAAHDNTGIEPLPATHAALRLETLLNDARLDPRMLLVAGTILLEHYHDLGAHHRGMPVCQLMLQLVRDGRVTEYRQARAHLAVAVFYWYASVDVRDQSRLKDSEKHVDAAHALARENGFQDVLTQIQLRQADIAWRQSRYADALEAVERARAHLSPRYPFVSVAFHQKRCMILLVMGRVRDALADARAGIDIGLRANLSKARLSFLSWLEATALFRAGEIDAAEASAARAIQHAPPGHAKAYGLARPVFQLWRAWSTGHPEWRAQLAHFFGTLSDARGVHTGMLMAPEMAQLCTVALQEGIETAFAIEMIRVRGFRPPAGNVPESWPWPLRVRVLGQARLWIDDMPFTSSGKAQKRPLELLYWLAAQGRRAFDGVAAARAIDALWPDVETDDPKNSLDAALHRLRKLLGLEDVVLLADGNLSLDASRVWTDAGEFDHAADQSDPLAAMDAVYAGELLPGMEQAWVLPLRERLRHRYVNVVTERGRLLEAEGQWNAALRAYKLGLTHDNLVEEFYAGCMRACHALKMRAEGLQHYRRCRELLSIVLGVEPSAQTEAIHRALKG